jgi:hypothetical protein
LLGGKVRGGPSLWGPFLVWIQLHPAGDSRDLCPDSASVVPCLGCPMGGRAQRAGRVRAGLGGLCWGCVLWVVTRMGQGGLETPALVGSS